MNPIAARYRTLLQSLDTWTATARQRHPGVIPCRQGCTACCHGPFDISVADVLLLRETVAELPRERRAALLMRAGAAAARQRELVPDWAAPFDVRDLGEARFDEVCEALATEACPCLEDGACVVYEGRPAVCRMMGLGLESLDDRRLANGCPIQAEFPAYAALPLQPFDLPAFETTEEACLVEAGLSLFDTLDAAGYETSIALALADQ
ncbi:MAG TPA: YkgJ family cysteine cluster protein [Gemmatimonadales bacterium]|nr:YkgJ family cysteine cluster protein [Gemmatimonadales bacterium]